MNVYVSVDMEGIHGVVDDRQVDQDRRFFRPAQRRLHDEVNAAVSGAFRGGAARVRVNDGHNAMINLLPGWLDERVELITGAPKPLSQLEGLEEEDDLIFFLGYHAAASGPGVLAHTYDERVVSGLFINGLPAGELLLNAVVAGSLNVPVGFVTGDVAVSEEVRALPAGGPVRMVATKKGVGQFSARHFPRKAVLASIEAEAEEAVRRSEESAPLILDCPFVFKVVFFQPVMAEAASLIPGVKRTGSCGITFESPGAIEGYRCFRAAVVLAGAVYSWH